MRRVQCLLVSIAAFSLVAAAFDKRTWTDASGHFHIDASFVSLEDGVVTLKKGDETTVKIPLERLGKVDQDFITKIKGPQPVEAKKPADQQGDSPWIIKTDDEKTVAAFPVRPTYRYYVGEKGGKIKEWECTTKDGLQASFQLFRDFGADPGPVVAQATGIKQASIVLGPDGRQEITRPNVLARVEFIGDAPRFALLVFKTKARNLSKEEIDTFRLWSINLLEDLKHVEAATSELSRPPLVAKNVGGVANARKPWLVRDEHDAIVAAFPSKPTMSYHMESVRVESKELCGRKREWKSISKSGLQVTYLILTGRQIVSMTMLGKLIGVDGNDASNMAMDNSKHEIIKRDSVVRFGIEYNRELQDPNIHFDLLIFKVNGRSLSTDELELYDLWNSDLVLAGKCLQARFADPPANDWIAKDDDGKIVADFSKKPDYQLFVTKKQSRVREWKFAKGESQITFQIVRGPELFSDFVEMASQLTGEKQDAVGKEITRPNLLSRTGQLRGGALLGEPLPDGRKNGLAILLFSTKARELSQEELEMYDRWSKDFALVERCLDGKK